MYGTHVGLCGVGDARGDVGMFRRFDRTSLMQPCIGSSDHSRPGQPCFTNLALQQVPACTTVVGSP
jgi:hypothetical protein